MALSDIIGRFISSPAELSTDFQILPQNTDNPERQKTAFKEYEHYFLVQINEMYLSKGRQWFNKIMPMVYTSVDFNYGKDKIESPFIVGQNLLRTQIKDLAKDMIFRDTNIAGWHPYAGSKLAITILLCKTTTENYLLRTLNVIEKVSGLFSANVMAMLKQITNVSKVVVDGLNTLFESKEVEGLACFRREFDSTTSGGFYPGYYVLLDKTIPESEKAKFYVKGNRLYYGDSMNTAIPYRDGDYVLFDIEQTETRGDYKTFPFYDFHNKALELASKKPVDDKKKEEIADELSAMLLAMLQSPEMIESHALKISDESYVKVKAIADRNYKMGVAAPQSGVNEAVVSMRSKIRSL